MDIELHDSHNESSQCRDTAYLKRTRAVIDGLESLREQLKGASSIADDVPALSELFHKARTSRRNAREGRYVGLYDYDTDTDTWACRSVAFLESGTHYRDTGADLTLVQKPYAFLSVEQFAEDKYHTIGRTVAEQKQHITQAEYDPLQ